MGNEIFLYLMTGKKEFVARVDPRTQVKPGQTIDMLVNMGSTHLFDRETERAIR